jgi:hypothetical protein
MVLDWERGRLRGIPAWDWFHYLVQTAVLVRKQPTAAVLERIDELLGSAAFKGYAHAAEITGFERELFIAYVLYVLHVIRPAEGLEQVRQLVEAAIKRLAR